MVDITRCERCGKVIPALESGCPYCEIPDQGLQEKPYLPLALRLLLMLFVANVAMTMVLAVFSLAALSEPGLRAPLVKLLALIRFLLGGVTLVALFFRESWARFVPLAFLGWEALTAVMFAFGLMGGAAWAGGLLAPVWNVLFVFLFLREDVQARFDASVRDKRELGDLLRLVEGGTPDDSPPRRKRR